MVAAASGCLGEALARLADLGSVREIRGRGLMMGVETDSGSRALGAVKALLREGIIALPDGPAGDIVAFTAVFHFRR